MVSRTPAPALCRKWLVGFSPFGVGLPSLLVEDFPPSTHSLPGEPKASCAGRWGARPAAPFAPWGGQIEEKQSE